MKDHNSLSYYPDCNWVKSICRYSGSDDPTKTQLERVKNFFSILPRTLDAPGLVASTLKEFDISISSILHKSHIKLDSILGVFIETREFDHLPSLIKSYLNSDIPLAIYCSKNNFHQINNLKDHPLLYSIRTINYETFTLKAYNALLMSNIFWETLPNIKKILTLQSDTFLSKDSNLKSLLKFITYDYIGSLWNPNRPIKIKINGGNGGLSLRDLYFSKRIIRTFGSINWPGGEDGFFGFFTEFLGGKVPINLEENKAFSVIVTPVRPNCIPFGMHKIPIDYQENRDFYNLSFPILKQIRSENNNENSNRS